MSQQQDGGPAFPQDHQLLDPRCDPRQFMGMSLRDYFASKALSALIRRGYDEVHEVAKLAYRSADAMLEARIKQD